MAGGRPHLGGTRPEPTPSQKRRKYTGSGVGAPAPGSLPGLALQATRIAVRWRSVEGKMTPSKATLAGRTPNWNWND